MTTATKMTTKYFFSQPLDFRVMGDDSYFGRNEYFTIGDFILADSEGEHLLDAKGAIEKYAGYLCELISQHHETIEQIDAFTAQWNQKTAKEKRQTLDSIDREYAYRLRNDRNRELAIFKTYDEALATFESCKDSHRVTGLRIESRHQ